MRKTEILTATFMLFAAVGAAGEAVVAGGLWSDAPVAAAIAVATVGLLAGPLMLRLFTRGASAEEFPVFMARYSGGAAVCIAVLLTVVFLMPLLEFAGRGAGEVALCGAGLLASIYAGLCFAAAARHDGERSRHAATAALAGLLAGPLAALAARHGGADMPQTLLACAALAAAASVVYGLRFRGGPASSLAYAGHMLRPFFALLLLLGGGMAAGSLLPAARRLAREAPETAALQPYLHSLKENLLEPSKFFLFLFAAVVIAYLAVLLAGWPSERFRAKHGAVRHLLASLALLAALGGLFAYSVAEPDFSRHCETVREFRAQGGSPTPPTGPTF